MMHSTPLRGNWDSDLVMCSRSPYELAAELSLQLGSFGSWSHCGSCANLCGLVQNATADVSLWDITCFLTPKDKKSALNSVYFPALSLKRAWVMGRCLSKRRYFCPGVCIPGSFMWASLFSQKPIHRGPPNWWVQETLCEGPPGANHCTFDHEGVPWVSGGSDQV